MPGRINGNNLIIRDLNQDQTLELGDHVKIINHSTKELKVWLENKNRGVFLMFRFIGEDWGAFQEVLIENPHFLHEYEVLDSEEEVFKVVRFNN